MLAYADITYLASYLNAAKSWEETLIKMLGGSEEA